MSVTLNEQIAPEIVRAIIAQATARGLSVNDYLRDLLGLTNEAHLELALAEEPQPRNEEMLAIIRRGRERLKDMPARGSMEETLRMIRRARAGEMWGYEPTDAAVAPEPLFDLSLVCEAEVCPAKFSRHLSNSRKNTPSFLEILHSMVDFQPLAG